MFWIILLRAEMIINLNDFIFLFKSVLLYATFVTYFITPYILTLGDVGMIKDDTKRIVSYVSKDVHDKLKKEAKYEDRTISKMIAKIIKEHYKIKDED